MPIGTVADLIAKLQELPPDAVPVTAGRTRGLVELLCVKTYPGVRDAHQRRLEQGPHDAHDNLGTSPGPDSTTFAVFGWAGMVAPPEQPAPVPYLSYEEMVAIAARGGTVVWHFSGIVERIVPAESGTGFTAWGYWTRPHTVRRLERYFCTPFEGNALAAVGNPEWIAPDLLR